MSGELALEVGRVVVVEDARRSAAVANALDHGGVVRCVGEDDTARHARCQRPERGPVGDIAGGEQEGLLLAVQVGQFPLEQHVIVICAGDVAGAAGSRAAAVQSLMHRREHDRVLAHAQIVVGAPDGDFRGAALRVIRRAREIPCLPLQIREHAITAFTAKPTKLLVEESFVVHRPLQLAAGVRWGSRRTCVTSARLLRSKKACRIRSSRFCRAVSRDPVCGF